MSRGQDEVGVGSGAILCGSNLGQHINCPTGKNRFAIIAKPNMNIVGASTLSVEPMLGEIGSNAGSTNSGEVIAIGHEVRMVDLMPFILLNFRGKLGYD